MTSRPRPAGRGPHLVVDPQASIASTCAKPPWRPGPRSSRRLPVWGRITNGRRRDVDRHADARHRAPRPRRPWRGSGVVVVRGRLDDRLRQGRVVRLERCRSRRTRPRHRAAWRRGVGRGADHRRRTAAPGACRSRRSPGRREQRPSCLASNSSGSSACVILRMSPRMLRRWRTASTTLPVPASPFERIMQAPSESTERLAEVVAPHTNGTV